MEQETQTSSESRSTEEATPAQLKLQTFAKSHRKFILRFCIRETLTIVLVYWFWDKSWMKYFLMFWVPLVIFNFLMLCNWDKLVARKAKQLNMKEEKEQNKPVDN